MKTKEKILETLLKIQELVESIADNQHRPKDIFYKPYSLPIPNMNKEEVKIEVDKSKQEVKDIVDEVKYYRGYETSQPVHESEMFTENEQPKKLYTKEEILEQYGKYHTEDDFLQTFGDWIRQKM